MYAAIDEIKDKLALHCGLNHIIYILFRSDQVIFKTQFFFSPSSIKPLLIISHLQCVINNNKNPACSTSVCVRLERTGRPVL